MSSSQVSAEFNCYGSDNDYYTVGKDEDSMALMEEKEIFTIYSE